MVDMEEGVLNSLLRGPLGASPPSLPSSLGAASLTRPTCAEDLFDSTQLLSETSGSGNNWACGACFYGPKYDAEVMESVRRAAEPCDSLQSFLMMHSLGGGTGSGMGSYLLSRLADEYPAAFRFAVSIFPSADDDVVTSPYNSILAADALAEHADVVLPMDNGALGDVCAATASRLAKQGGRTQAAAAATGALVR